MKIFKKIGSFFQQFFSKEYAFLKKNSHIAVKITGILKDIVESPLTRAVIELTPTGIDNALHAKVTPIIQRVAFQMAIAHGIIDQASTNSNVIAALIEHIRKIAPDGRSGFYMDFAAKV